VQPPGGGTVEVDPAPNCAGGKYVAGTQVELTASPAEGYLFRTWGGDLSGSENPASLRMDGDKAVTALFRDENAPLFMLYLPLAVRDTP
jgi:hypothetical protein